MPEKDTDPLETPQLFCLLYAAGIFKIWFGSEEHPVCERADFPVGAAIRAWPFSAINLRGCRGNSNQYASS